MKVIIAGGRYFTDYKILCQFCDEILQNQNMIKIVSGGARGADLLGENYAKEGIINWYDFLQHGINMESVLEFYEMQKWQNMQIF
jgi:hypothetical protein